MVLKRALAFAAVAVLAAGPVVSNAADKKPLKTAEEQQAGWDDSRVQQPATESIDLNAYNASAKRVFSTRT